MTPTLRDEDLDGITGVELENAVIQMAAQEIAWAFEDEVLRLIIFEGLTFDEIFGEPDEGEEGWHNNQAEAAGRGRDRAGLPVPDGTGR